MIKPRILAMFMVLVFLSCKETRTSNDSLNEPPNSDPAISAPEMRRRDSLRMNPARRELRKKENENRKKGLDTLKPVTT